MFKVMTLNINAYESKQGPWEVRKKLIGETIRATDPDVIALQAVTRNPEIENGVDQASQLAKSLPEYKDVIFQEATKRNNGIVEGLAVLSKIKIIEKDHRQLSLLKNTEDINRRVLLNVLLETTTQPIRLFIVHFSWIYEQTFKNIQETLAYMQSFKDPALLMGDMNMLQESYPLVKFRDDGWKDLWHYLHPEKVGFTYESSDPEMRIDYVWSNPALIDQIEDIEIIGQDQQEGDVRLSDHFGLLVTLNV